MFTKPKRKINPRPYLRQPVAEFLIPNQWKEKYALCLHRYPRGKGMQVRFSTSLDGLTWEPKCKHIVPYNVEQAIGLQILCKKIKATRAGLQVLDTV